MKKLVLILFPVLVVALGGWALRSESDFFLVSDIPVEIEFEDGQAALIDSLRTEISGPLQALKGANIWKVGISQVRDQLLENAWVEEVEIRRSFPDKVSTLIHLMPIAFLYVDAKNVIYPVTKYGDKLQPVKTAVVPVAPVLRNPKVMESLSTIKKIIQQMEEVPNLGILRRDNIAMIDYQSTTGLTLQLAEGEETVHLGETSVSTKGLQVLRVTDYLKSQKVRARVIDASFTKKVLVRPRKGP